MRWVLIFGLVIFGYWWIALLVWLVFMCEDENKE